MAITKAQILTEIDDNLQTALSQAQADIFIQKTLDDLSEEDLLVGVDDSQTLSNGDTTLDEPDGYRARIAITLTVTSGSSEQFPLIPLKGGHEAYRMLRHNDDSVGIPRRFSRFNAKFYLWRPPNQDFSVKIEHYKDHPALSGDSGSILFGDNFKNVLFAGSTFWAAMKHSRIKALTIWKPMYDDAKQKRILSMPRNPRVVKG